MSGQIDCKGFQDLILDYTEKELDSNQLKAFESHFTACPECMDYLNSYTLTIDFCKEKLSPEHFKQKMPPAVKKRICDFLKNLPEVSSVK